jgi:hypothetical protein
MSNNLQYAKSDLFVVFLMNFVRYVCAYLPHKSNHYRIWGKTKECIIFSYSYLLYTSE